MTVDPTNYNPHWYYDHMSNEELIKTAFDTGHLDAYRQKCLEVFIARKEAESEILEL